MESLRDREVSGELKENEVSISWVWGGAREVRGRQWHLERKNEGLGHFDLSKNKAATTTIHSLPNLKGNINTLPISDTEMMLGSPLTGIFEGRS